MGMIVAVALLVTMGIQLEQHGAHHGIRARVEAQGVIACIEVKCAAPLKGQRFLQEIPVQGELVVQIKSMQVDDLIHREVGLLGMQNLGNRVDGQNLTFEVSQLLGRHEVGLVEDDAVSEGDLRLGLGRVVEVQGDVLGVDKRDDAIETEVILDLFVAEEGLSDRAGIRQAGGFDQHVVEPVPALHELAEDANQVAADGAAKAPVVHLEDLLVGLDDEFVVDADLTELVLDHGDALAVIGGQDAVQQGGLAGAKKAREDGHRNARVVVFGHSVPPPCWKVLPMANPAVVGFEFNWGFRGPIQRPQPNRTGGLILRPTTPTTPTPAGSGRSKHWNVNYLTPSRVQRESSACPHVPCERRTDPAPPLTCQPASAAAGPRYPAASGTTHATSARAWSP